MNLDFTKLNYKFTKKPLLIGGKAKEYYGVRKAGKDIDLVISKEDFAELLKIYPNNTKDLTGDLGIIIYEFEIWKSICWFDYDYLRKEAIEKDRFLVISLEKLLFLTALAKKNNQKYRDDLDLIVDKVIENISKQGPPK